MKRFMKTFVSILIVSAIIAVSLSCLPASNPGNDAGAYSPITTSANNNINKSDLATDVVNLALSQNGQKQGIGDFETLTWADNKMTYCEVFVSAIVTKAVGKSPLTQRPIFGDIAYNDYEAHIKLVKQGTPPKGAIVYYAKDQKANQNCGHVGIADGSGQLISVLSTSGVQKSGFDEKSIGASMLGWIYPDDYFVTNNSVSVSTGTNITNTSLPLGTNIQYGQVVTGHIAFAHDYQNWKFSGQAGDVITIHMVQDGGASLHPGAALLDPSGTKVTSDSNSNGNSEAWIKNYTLVFSGIYTINAIGDGNYYGATTGGYKLNITLKAPVVTMVYGQVVTGHIVFDHDYQNWKFSGQAGDVITIHMVQDGGASLHPGVALLDPSGKNVTSDSNSNGNSEAWIKNYTLVFSGIYTINAIGDGNYYGATTGGYKLNVTLKAPVASIGYGQVVTGQIAFTYDYQNWKFSGQAGDVITIHMVQDGGASLHPGIALLDPSGKNVTSDSNSNGNSEAWIKNYALVFPGIYTINAIGSGNYYNPTTGGYKLSLNKN